MITYTRFSIWLSLRIARIERGEISSKDFERDAFEMLRKLVETVNIAYELLRKISTDEMCAAVARVINVIVFDFMLDEFRCFPRFMKSARQFDNSQFSDMLDVVEKLFTEMVAISEWDGSVSQDRFEEFRSKIAHAKSLLEVTYVQ